MHSIKKAARREAWYHNDSDENRTYNPFSRITRASARPLPHHEELGTSDSDDRILSVTWSDDGDEENKRSSKAQHVNAHSKREAGPKIKVMPQVKAICFDWTRILFIFVPAGFVVNYTYQGPVVIFIVNFFAIIPSSSVLAYAIDESTLYVGDVIGGLLSMSFG